MTAPPMRDYGHLVVAAGPNVRIRRKVREDAEDDFRWRMDPENTRFDGNNPPQQSFAEFLQQLESDLAFGLPEKELFAIMDPDGRHVGNVMYYHADSLRGEAELGISLGAEADRGRGLGSQSTVLLLRYLWHNYPFRRIYLHTLAWNERAIRSFHKAGFDEVARVLRDGEPFVRMEARREWWLLWDEEGRFARAPQPK